MLLEDFLNDWVGDFAHRFDLSASDLELQGSESEEGFETSRGLWSLEGSESGDASSGRCQYQLRLNSEFVSEVDVDW